MKKTNTPEFYLGAQTEKNMQCDAFMCMVKKTTSVVTLYLPNVTFNNTVLNKFYDQISVFFVLRKKHIMHCNTIKIER